MADLAPEVPEVQVSIKSWKVNRRAKSQELLLTQIWISSSGKQGLVAADFIRMVEAEKFQKLQNNRTRILGKLN